MLRFDTTSGVLIVKEVPGKSLLSRFKRRRHIDCLHPCFLICKGSVTLSISTLAFLFAKEAYVTLFLSYKRCRAFRLHPCVLVSKYFLKCMILHIFQQSKKMETYFLLYFCLQLFFSTK